MSNASFAFDATRNEWRVVSSERGVYKYPKTLQKGVQRDPFLDANFSMVPETLALLIVEQTRNRQKEIAGWGYIDESQTAVWLSVLSVGSGSNVVTTPQDMHWSQNALFEAIPDGVLNMQWHTHNTFLPFFSQTDEKDIAEHLDFILEQLPSGEYWAVVAGYDVRNVIARRYVWKDGVVKYNEGNLVINGVKFNYTQPTSQYSVGATYSGWSGTTQKGTVTTQQTKATDATSQATSKKDKKRKKQETQLALSQSRPDREKLLNAPDSCGLDTIKAVAVFEGSSSITADNVTKYMLGMGCIQQNEAMSMMNKQTAAFVAGVIKQKQSDSTSVVGKADETLLQARELVGDGDGMSALYLVNKLTLEQYWSLNRMLLPSEMLHSLLHTCSTTQGANFADVAISLHLAVLSENSAGISYNLANIGDDRTEFVAYINKHGISELIPTMHESGQTTSSKNVPYAYKLFDAIDAIETSGNTVFSTGYMQEVISGMRGTELLALFLYTRDFLRKNAQANVIHDAAVKSDDEATIGDKEVEALAIEFAVAFDKRNGKDVADVLTRVGHLGYVESAMFYNMLMDLCKNTTSKAFSTFSKKIDGIIWIEFVIVTLLTRELYDKTDTSILRFSEMLDDIESHLLTSEATSMYEDYVKQLSIDPDAMFSVGATSVTTIDAGEYDMSTLIAEEDSNSDRLI